MKKHLGLIFLFLQFLTINIYSMESKLELSEQDIVMQEVSDTVINIGKTNFVGEKKLTDLLPLEMWQEVASFLEYNDPALVYFLGPRVGLTKRQSIEIAAAFYNNLFKIVKNKKDFTRVLKLHDNVFDYFRHRSSRLLLIKLIQEKNNLFLDLKNEYFNIHEKITWSMRFNRVQEALVEFWKRALANIKNNYSEQNNLSTLSDEKLVELNFLLSNLNKLYKAYKGREIYINPGNKVLITCMFIALCIGMVFLGAFLEIYWMIPVALAIPVLVVMGLSNIDSEPSENFYLKDINSFFDAVKNEIELRKNGII